MSFFSDDQLASMQIERMVFHLVGPTDSSFVMLEEIDPTAFRDFFLERIASVNLGASYKFDKHSATRDSLLAILKDTDTFQAQSEAMATDFQKRHTGAMAPGALLLFLLDVRQVKYFAILKSDDETVLAYDVEEGKSGRKRVSLEALQRTFVQNKEALQKSALIRVDDTSSDITVLDRRNQTRVAAYFEAFLGATRDRDDAELTAALVDVTRAIIWKNKDSLPPEVVADMNKRTYGAANAGGEIKADDQKSFLEASIGRKLDDTDPLAKAYAAALKVARISGTPVRLTAAKVKDAKTIRFVTTSGIELRVPVALQNLVQVENGRIIINDAIRDRFDDTR